MDLDDFARLVLAVEGVVESQHFGKRDFRLSDRIIASLPESDLAVLRLSPDRQTMAIALHGETFAPVPNAWGAKGWTRMRLGGLDAELARTAIGWAVADAAPARGTRRPRR